MIAKREAALNITSAIHSARLRPFAWDQILTLSALSLEKNRLDVQLQIFVVAPAKKEAQSLHLRVQLS